METKRLQIHDASVHVWSATVTAASVACLSEHVAGRFGLNSVPTHLYRLLSAPPNRAIDELAEPLDLGSDNSFDLLQDGGLYSIHEKVLSLAFSASTPSPTSHIDIPIPMYDGDLLDEAKKAMLMSYNLAPDAPCDVRAVVTVAGVRAFTDISTSEELRKASSEGWPLRITIDREAKTIPGVEVGIRNIVELAVKMLMVFGDLKTTPTNILKDFAWGEQPSLPWMHPIFERLGVPIQRRLSFWRSLCTAYDDLSSQVLHIQYDQMMPAWDEINEKEAVECFSPTRTSIPALHAKATFYAKEMIKYLVEQGLNENLVMATFYLRLVDERLLNGTASFRGEITNLYLTPNDYLQQSLKQLYSGMSGNDEKLTAWAKERLLAMYSASSVTWPLNPPSDIK
ncbi:hypothetical protein HDU87_008767 [Geranomyces variabilis]|uniref:Uncharacterized protein n=1 Tax=Geranomyces variabilis TaxID=109894 RepID=A0AAD5XMI2_9FUNG|nr:hypothetical protein HDU87_008767 [Geranomyces variabilis]